MLIYADAEGQSALFPASIEKSPIGAYTRLHASTLTEQKKSLDDYKRKFKCWDRGGGGGGVITETSGSIILCWSVHRELKTI